MKWVTREHPKIDRVACPWLIARIIDPAAEFLYVPADQVLKVAVETGAVGRMRRAWPTSPLRCRGGSRPDRCAMRAGVEPTKNNATHMLMEEYAQWN